MTKGELIKHLEKFPDDTPVQIDDCEFGLLPLRQVEPELTNGNITLSVEDSPVQR